MTQRFESPFELKFMAETGMFEGYASVFDVTDSVNDRIAPGAFRRALQEYKAQGRLPALLWQHDTKQPIGAWREMYEDGHGLFVKGDLFITDIARAKEAYRLMRESVVTGLSIGYRVRQSHRDEKTGCRILTDIDLLEISMVTFPANDMARILRVKSALESGGVPSMKEFEAFLREAGLSRKQAKGVMALGYKSLLHDAAGAGVSRDAEDAGHDSLSEADAISALAAKIRSLSTF